MRARFVFLFLLVGGCAAEPFARENLPRLSNPDPASMSREYAASQPLRFTSDDTIIIQAPFHDEFAFLAVMKIDRPAGTFEMVALNQLGVKLFHIGGDRQNAAIRFAIPPLMAQKDFLLSVAGDVRRIYFDSVPAGDARIRIDPTDVQFGKNDLVYILGGQPPGLLEKRQDGIFGPAWRVRYYLYASESGRLFPRGIVMDNNQFHYRLIVKNRDWENQ